MGAAHYIGRVGGLAYTLGEVDPRTGAVTVTFNVTDADGDSLGYQETSAPAKGGLPLDGIHGTTWTYVPTADARIQAGASNATDGDKQDTFTISVSDGIAPPIAITVKVPVTPAPAPNTVIATIPAGQGVGPTDVVLSPDGKRLYVLNGISGGVSIIDTATNTNIGVVPPLPTGPSPTAMALSADGTRLYITGSGYNGGPDQVVVVDTAKLYYPETVANIAVGDYPAAVAVSRDGKYLYVANSGDNTISVITLV